MKRTHTIAAMLAVSAAFFAPLPAMAQADLRIVINTAPPAAKFESVPAAREGYIWAPGFWNWDGRRHVWSAGHWETARNGYQFQRSEWIRDSDGYRLSRGGWQQVAQRDEYIRVAPPEPRFERTPRARRGYLWVSGHWEWRGNRHEWVSGEWVRERPGYVYHQANWIERDGHWVMAPSRWGRPGDRDHDGIPDRLERRDRDHDGVPDRLERRDRDHDGVPDSRDRDRDNDGVPNRRDADRDGDGVRNSQDRRPDNPRRN